MQFTVYKPKGDRVRAVQITKANAEEVAAEFNGRVVGSRENGIEGEVNAVQIPTLDGIKTIPFGDWIVKTEGHGLKFVKDAEFQQTYEPAYKTATRA